MLQSTLNEFSRSEPQPQCPLCSNLPADEKLYRERKTLVHLYKDHNRTQKEIASDLDCSRTTVKTWFKKHDITTSRFEYEIPKPKLNEWYHDREWTIQQIADHIGCSYLAVHHRMELHGIERRPSRLPDDPDADLRYRDESFLREKYHGEGLSKGELAELCSVTESAIQASLLRHDIDARSYSAAQRLRRE
ncbi:hypothetical protein GQS65_18500, partial [Halomarina oriensis]|nr:hypothetical protein [Halomarina oriensis]